MRYIISVVDTVDGSVIARAETGSLRKRTFVQAMLTAGVSAKGVYRGDPHRYVVYVKDTEERRWHQVADALKRYQSETDTSDYGLEWYVFHDLYLSDYERTQLLHAGEAFADRNELELQARLTREDRDVIQKLHDIRSHQMNAISVPCPTLYEMRETASSGKYHRVYRGA